MGSALSLKILLGLFIVFSILGIVLFFLTRTPSQNLVCDSFSNMTLGSSDCGIAVSYEDGKSYDLVGKIVRENDIFIDLALKDVKGRVLNERFSYLDLENSVGLTGVPSGDFLGSDVSTWPSDLATSAESSSRLSEGMEIVVVVFTPTLEEIKQIEGLSEKDLSCLPYNEYFIQYLKEPTLKNRARLLSWRYLRRCSVLLSQIYHIR